MNEYDIGLPDSPYFADVNEGCTKEVVTTYCDCKGVQHCIVRKELLPYIQKYEILAPVFIATTWGAERYYNAHLTQDAYKKKSKTIINITYPFKVGDILKVDGSCCAKYFIKAKLGKDKFNNFIYQILRLDGFNIVALNLDELTKKKRLFVTGYLGDKSQE